MIFDMPDCGGCRTCELVCSFYQKKVFNPGYSSIKIVEREGGKGYSVHFTEREDRFPCDACAGEDSPHCLEVCEKKDELRGFINSFQEKRQAQTNPEE